MMATLNPSEIIGVRDFGGWPLPIYLLFFVYGFIVMSHDGLQKRIERQSWISLAAGAGAIAAMLCSGHPAETPPSVRGRYVLFSGLYGLQLVALDPGLPRPWIPVPDPEHTVPDLRQRGGAALLHHAPDRAAGHRLHVTRWQIPDLAKALTIGVSSFAVIVALYEFLIRRTYVLRVLFGMKPQPAGQLRPNLTFGRRRPGMRSVQ